MSNGIKVGLLVVIAGALGFLGYSQFKKGSDSDISSRPATEVADNNTATSTAASESDMHNHDHGTMDNANTASANRAKTSVKFDKTLHDFGHIKQGDSVECVFKVTNTGDEPLVIENAQGSCGCTVPDYPKEPIPAGETREIKVKFNSAGKKDKQSKTVTITANTDPTQSVLTVQSFVEAPEAK